MTTPAAPTTPAIPQTLLAVRRVAKSFGKNVVLRDVSLEIAQGEFLSILGESGSGKTTLLRLIAGFEHPDSGEISMAGERIDQLAANPGWAAELSRAAGPGRGAEERRRQL